jgi:hypothetical protein
VEYKIHQIFPGGIYLYWIIHQGGETRQKGEEIRRHVCVGDKFIRFNINLYTSLKNKVAYLFNVVILLFPCALCRRHRRFFFLSHPARFEILVTKRGPAAAAEDREKNIIYNIWTACNKNGQQPHTLMTVPFWFFRLVHVVINGASYCVERRGLVWVSLFVIVFNVAEWFFELFILTCPQNETRKINSNFFYFILQDFWVNQTVFFFHHPAGGDG